MPSHLDSIFGSIFHRFLPPSSIPCTVKIIVFPKEKRGFFKKSLFEVGIDFCSILVPTCLHFPSQNPPKSFQKPILKGIDFLIDFDIDFKTAQEGPKTAHDGDPSAKTAPRGSQDGPKMAPRGPKSSHRIRVFSILAAKSLQGPPETPPRLIFGPFLVDFWLMFDGFLIDFWSILDSLFG